MEIPVNIRQAEFPYCIFDGGGKVMVSTMDNYPVGEAYDLSIIGTNQYYMVPIIRGESMTGLLLVDYSQARQTTLEGVMRIEVGLAFLLFLIICLMRYSIHRVMKTDIWNPVEEIHESTRSILNGNYREKILYDYRGEIGMLCHDFEKMRDEICAGAIREQQSREKERVLYASISHDLKTPLAIIIGYLEQILYGVVALKNRLWKQRNMLLLRQEFLIN